MTATLKMPATYVAMDSDEMEYLEGGYRIDWTTSGTARNIDIAVAIVSWGFAAGATIGKVAAAKGVAWLQGKVASALIQIGLTNGMISATLSLIGTVLNLSIGSGVAWLLDGNDHSVGGGRNNRIQFR